LKNITRFHVEQAFKAAVAGVIALYAAELLKLPQAYWAPISAFIVLHSDVKSTFQASLNRLAGTAIGAVLGAVFVYLLGSHILWMGLAVFITVVICAGLKLKESYRLACVTVAIVMLIKSAGSPWATAMYRFLEVALGIAVALAISTIFPKSQGEF
jgi:uncharacterized membrane protein YgaE (UPF0421/DUF939 family)